MFFHARFFRLTDGLPHLEKVISLMEPVCDGLLEDAGSCLQLCASAKGLQGWPAKQNRLTIQ